MVLKIQPKFLPGQRCEVLNPLKRPAAWEPGEVQIIKVLIGKTGNQSFIYNVQLDRRTARVSKAYPNGKLMFFNATNAQVREISK